MSCPDQKGLVAEVSSFIFRHGGNIMHAEQHIDPSQGTFFHRVEWELEGFHINGEELSACFKTIADRFHMQWRLSYSSARRKMAIFVSRYEHCLLDLLYRQKIGELRAEVVAVISNHPNLKPVADFYGIPFHVFPITNANKADQERRELELLTELTVDLVVLARYMQVLTPDFVSTYPSRIINIHHSFLPAFIGSKPYNQAYERGVKVIGATAQKGRDLESQVLGRAVRLHLLDRVLPYGK